MKHIEPELSRLERDYGSRLQIVAISSNSTRTHPQDGPEGLREQAQRNGWCFSYLFDATQAVARAFQAACTPDLFLFNGEQQLVYRGQLDGSRPGQALPCDGRDLRTALDALLILWLQRKGMRWLEALIIALISLVTVCFAIEIVISRPDVGAVLAGYVPSAAILRVPEMLYLAIGILGATVMPHNLYLHSALVQSREIEPTEAGRREACRLNLVDSAIALNAALFVNFAILVLAAAAFFRYGFHEDAFSSALDCSRAVSGDRIWA